MYCSPVEHVSSIIRRVKHGRLTLPGGNRRRSPRISGLDSLKIEPDSGSLHKLEKPARPSCPVLQLQETGSRENATNFPEFHPQLLKPRRLMIMSHLVKMNPSIVVVVDNYEIIKEPMDFGTMKAKLHEGIWRYPKMKLLPWEGFPPAADLVTSPLLAIQINTFECGGMALGMQISHTVADTFSLLTFVNEWASTHREAENVNGGAEILSPIHCSQQEHMIIII